MDGGTHSPTNAHRAAGYDRVVLLAPVASGGGPLASGAQQAARRTEQGARVAVIAPSPGAKRVYGRNVPDPAVRAASARAGREQAGHVAEAGVVGNG